MQINKFPFTKVSRSYFGTIYRPYIDPVWLFSEKRNDWIFSRMIVDTGADYTLLSRRYAINLGIDLIKECLAETTLGVGGSETVYLYKNLKIKIGNIEQIIPVGFLERDDVPPLLGRLKCLEDLEVILKNHQTILKN